MYYAHWDWGTLFLYIFIGLITILLIRQAEKNTKIIIDKQNIYEKKYNKSGKKIYLIIFFILVIFASSRLVTTQVGGKDAGNFYVPYFNDLLRYKLNLKNFVIFQGSIEPGFYFLTYMIRLVTDNYHIYFLFIYGIISYSYLKFISDNISDKCYIFPFFLFLLPYLYSFAAIRSSLAVAFFLIGMVYLRNNKDLYFFIFSFIAFLFHYTAFIAFVFYLYYKIDFFHKDKIFGTIVCNINSIDLQIFTIYSNFFKFY